MEPIVNKGKSIVGHVSDYTKRKGWFFGSFMDEPLLQTDLAEVAWQQIPNLKPSLDQTHFHTSSVEINIIIQGKMQITIDGQQHELQKGDFYVIWPESVVSNITTDKDTELIVVRAPSINDKVSASTKS
ncbi:MAG TPA: cupin domain-containing protein [Candidatus Saccharimonadales bacterium]|nr:cupin domain-containing protein [Candidatus Saccharimonadales bacterium]